MTETYCASGQAQQAKAVDIAPHSGAGRAVGSEASGSHNTARPGLRPQGSSHCAHTDTEGMSAQNEFGPKQKRILLFNRKIGLHNCTICIHPNPSPLTLSASSSPRPDLTEQQWAPR